jgi:hypothetical protein
MRKLYLASWIFFGALVWIAYSAPADVGVGSLRFTHPAVPEFTPRGVAASWFGEIRPFCNPVEVETRMSWTPPPDGFEGAAFAAACFALAGMTDRARSMIDDLGGDDRWRAAGVVFNVAHPVADAGNDAAAGPIMELVVEFWPNHYMALYHAGMARLGLGDDGGAAEYLVRFLEHYELQDGWTSSARMALEELGAR